MTDDGQQKYHHKADEGATCAPAGKSADPHHALNTPVEGIADAALRAQQHDAERIEDAEDEHAIEDRSLHG